MTIIIGPPTFPPVHIGKFALDNSSPLIDFYLHSKSSVIQYETLQIYHSSFSKVYWIVRNAMNGLDATLEDGTLQHFDYYPLAITATGAADDLDQSLKISVGDLGEIIPQELDRCMAAGTMNTKPSCTYRTFRSDSLAAPMDGPYVFDIPNFAQKASNVTFTASAPKLNSGTTGEAYTTDRFPMMRGFFVFFFTIFLLGSIV